MDRRDGGKDGRMRLSKPVEIRSVSQTLARGNCPVCAFLRNSQSALLQGGLRPEEVRGICNFHAWALAAAVNVINAAKVFQNLLRLGCDGSEECSFCERLRDAEQAQLRELVGQMDRRLVLDWMKNHGVLCRPHARRIRQIAPVRLHAPFEEVDRRTASDLNSELEDLVNRSSGERAGAGVLGRVAGFLMSQRGISG
jgi:hypothetical protein